MTATTNGTQLELTGLTPMPYRLGYGIPLLVMSCIVAFAGAFLMLDRTRSFAPLSLGKYAKHVVYRLEGGVGGLVAGWAFGVHLVTALVLVISNKTAAAPLGTIQFLVVWALSSIVTSLVAGRWRLAALLFVGLNGGAALALALGVVVHPMLLVRLIFLAVLTPVLAICTLVPVPKVQLPAVRLAVAASGAFGIIVGGAVLGNVASWANIWDRIWLEDSVEWSTNAERGMSAAFWVLVALGYASNWALRWKFGENPDEKWDSYLANYAASLPTRAGTFQPRTTWFDKWFKGTPSEPVVFPSDAELHTAPFSSPMTQGKLRTKAKKARKSGAVKFQPLKDVSESDSDSDLDLKPPPPARLLATNASSSSSVTAVSDRARDKRKAMPTADESGEYSDAEDALPALSKHQSPPRGAPGWKPAFLERARSGSPSAPPPPGAVPVTPSLIKALDRIQLAQTTAYGSVPPSPGLSRNDTNDDDNDEARRAGWHGFWKDVRAKAAEPVRAPPGLS